MKIALLVPGGVDRSGTVKVIPCLLWLIERLVTRGHEVHVFVPRQEDRPCSWQLLGATVHNVGRRRAAPWMLGSIAAEHRRAPFAVIHAFWTGLGAIGAVAGKVLRVPLVVTLPGGDIVRLPEIGYGALLSRRGRIDLRVAVRVASRVTAPSQFMRSMAAALGIDAAVVPLGVDLNRWPTAAARARHPSAPIKLLHVADLNRVKDQPKLLEAAVRLRAGGVPFELTIIGFDTLGGEIQRMADRLGLGGQVRFHGTMPHPDLRPWFAWADLLVVTSRHEAGPLVMLEAAVAGVPTVGTRVGHLADYSPHAAFAVPIADASALAEAIGILAADEERRLSLAAAAQALALRYDAAFTAFAFEEIYQDVQSG